MNFWFLRIYFRPSHYPPPAIFPGDSSAATACGQSPDRAPARFPASAPSRSSDIISPVSRETVRPLRPRVPPKAAARPERAATCSAFSTRRMRSALSSEACRNEKTSCKDPCRRSVNEGAAPNAARPLPRGGTNEVRPSSVIGRRPGGEEPARAANRNAQRSGKRKPSPILLPPRNRYREGAQNRLKEVSWSPDAKGPRLPKTATPSRYTYAQKTPSHATFDRIGADGHNKSLGKHGIPIKFSYFCKIRKNS